MHVVFSHPPRGQKHSRRGQAVLRYRLIVLLLCCLFTLATPGISVALAAGTHGGPTPHSWTPAQIHAIQQALKKRIHVKHTRRPLTPAQGQTPKPLRARNATLPPYNNIGISDPSTRSSADFDGGHRSYSAQALQDVGLFPGISVTSQNITFIWPSVPTGQDDNYLANGQVIPVSSLPGAATVGFLGAAAQGSSSGTATLTYTDGTTSTFTLGFTDWATSTLQFNNQQVVHMTTTNTKHGTKKAISLSSR